MSDEHSGVAAGAVVNFSTQPRRRRDTLDLEDRVAERLADADSDEDDYQYAGFRVRQYAEGVVDFSSQYGSDYSISYTATNIAGRPTKYPEYGDFPETFAMRTYGDWWQRVPSAVPEIQSQNVPKTPAHDFIVLSFEEYIIPDEIAIFETFNPGAVVRIWAYTITKSWICLWECADFELRRSPTHKKARRFAPPIKKLRVPTRTIRLEFNHSHVNYFTEIDAVILSGNAMNIRHLLYNVDEGDSGSSIVCKLQHMRFRPDFRDNYKNSLHDFFVNDLNKFIDVVTTPISGSTAALPAQHSKMQLTKPNFKNMPFEIVMKIFSFLDLISLFRAGAVCRSFYDVSTQPLLYAELNLKPYWHLATSELLRTLASRSRILRKLDLSWCGLNCTISPTEFKKLVQQRGDTLTHLRLNSCRFLNASCIEMLGIVCDNLKELTLRNCSTDLPLLNFSCLANLKNLERLDLFQTAIEKELLLTMLESNTKLKHLNLAYCGVAVNMNDVAQHIGLYNQQLISLDMWKSHLLSASGLLALANCHDLEELDVGWCLRDASLGDSLKRLISNCPKLRKLFLAIVRGMTDADVAHIANCCKNLEQLDLTGVFAIAKERYLEILTKCTRLQLLDLSFCDNTSEHEISLWSRRFNVQIKCSQLTVT